MIYTVTFNPSIDYVMFTTDFKLDGLNRATRTHKFAGGKGINVSRVLRTLDVTSTALGFIGGFPGAFITSTLNEARIHTDFIEVDEDTRMNVKLKTGVETEINAPGPKVTTAQFNALLDQMRQTTSQDTVIVAGSVPGSIPSDAYAQIARILQQTGAHLVVDAEKSLVMSVLQYAPLFIKPNIHELEAMYDTKMTSDDMIVTHAKKILGEGAQAVIVSLGGDGAIYVDASQQLKAEIPKGHVVNTVGAGDSTVAGMVAGLHAQQSVADAFKLAVACGTATAFNDDLASREAIKDVESQVRIIQLDRE